MTLADLRKRLRGEIKQAGGLEVWAREHGLRRGELAGVVLRGDRAPGKTLLRAMNVEVVVSYRIKRATNRRAQTR